MTYDKQDTIKSIVDNKLGKVILSGDETRDHNAIMKELLESNVVIMLSRLYAFKQNNKKLPVIVDHEDIQSEVISFFYRYNRKNLTELYKNKKKFFRYLMNIMSWKAYQPISKALNSQPSYQRMIEEYVLTNVESFDIDENDIVLTIEPDFDEKIEVFKNKTKERKMNKQQAVRFLPKISSVYLFLTEKRPYQLLEQKDLEDMHDMFFKSRQISWHCADCILSASQAVWLKFKRHFKVLLETATEEEIGIYNEINSIEKIKQWIPTPQIVLTMEEDEPPTLTVQLKDKPEKITRKPKSNVGTKKTNKNSRSL